MTILTYLLLTLFLGHANEEMYIEVALHNLQNSKGQILISLYDGEEGFPYEPKTYYTFPKSDIVNGKMIVRLPVSKPGKYALSVVDDENKNNDMDKNWVGIPKEGFGFSNDAKPRGMNPPAFTDASFQIKDTSQRVTIHLKYY